MLPAFTTKKGNSTEHDKVEKFENNSGNRFRKNLKEILVSYAKL